jgi:PKD repeat protein
MNRILLLLLLITSTFAQAQLTNWSFKKAFQVVDVQNRTDFQVLFVIDTETLINAGQLNADGSDLRFALDCDGTTLLDFYIDGRLDTSGANIWVKMNLAAATAETVFMFYGNTTATPTSDFATLFPNAYIVDADVIVDQGVDTLIYDWIEIKPGVKLTLNPVHTGVLYFKARNIVVDGIIDGDSLGYAGGAVDDGEGPGKGYGNDFQGAGGYGCGTGAGHGGLGGIGDTSSVSNDISDPVGIVYDDNTQVSIDAGSGGGVGGYLGPSTIGGDGGAGFGFIAAKIKISGTVTVNGQTPFTFSFYGAGGGSGGGVMLKADFINVLGNINARGGNGGRPDPAASFGIDAGGGGGGRVKFYHSKQFLNSAAINVEGGTSYYIGREPGDGTVFDSTLKSIEPAISLLALPSQLALNVLGGSNVICQGDSLVVSTDGGFANYDYYLNQNLDGSDTNNYTYQGLNDGDTLRVETSFGGCVVYSDSLFVSVISSPTVSFSSVVDEYEVTFTNSSLNGTDFVWEFGDGVIDAALDPVHVYGSTGTFTACLFATNACGSDSICEVITIECPSIITDFDFDINNLTVSFSDTTLDAISWLWDFGNGDSSLVENPQFMYADSTATYTVCLTTSNNCGSQNTFCQEVSIVGTSSIFETEKSQMFTIFPNPTTSYVEIVWRGHKEALIEFYNAFGQKVISEKITSGDKISTNDLPKGMYHVKVIGNEQLQGTQSIIVE